jgi:hypothetical protein
MRLTKKEEKLIPVLKWGYTSDRKSVVSKAINWACGGAFAHSIIVYEWRTKSGRVVKTEYYESKATGLTFTPRDVVTPITIIDGLRGPLPISKLYDWHSEDPSNHRIFIHEIHGLTPTEVQVSVDFLDAHVGRVRYDRLQILKNANYLLTGLCGLRQTRNAAKWTCSETQIKTVPARVARWMGCGPEFTAEESVPSSRKAHQGNMENAKRWNLHATGQLVGKL